MLQKSWVWETGFILEGTLVKKELILLSPHRAKDQKQERKVPEALGSASANSATPWTHF
jgi:hypothetical protein